MISIIGILSSVVLSATNKARSKAMDAQRISTLQQISKALGLYCDKNGHYPIATPRVQSADGFEYYSSNSWNNISTYLNCFISTAPKDPSTNATGIPPSTFGSGWLGYTYWTTSTGDKYQLMGGLENSNPVGCSNNNYKTIVPYRF